MEHQLTIYNTLDRKKELFVPLHAPHVGMYVCGPTVYGNAHLGHARPAITFDVLFRYLTRLGYKVRYVRNITDVGHLEHDADEGEDKIAKKARLEQLEPMEVVQYYLNRYHKAMEALNVLPPSIEPHASGHIIEQIELVKKILDAGYAYESQGSVYFDVAKYNKDYHYGKLSGRNLDDVLNTTRELDGQEEKHNPADFALWKRAPPEHIIACLCADDQLISVCRKFLSQDFSKIFLRTSGLWAIVVCKVKMSDPIVKCCKTHLLHILINTGVSEIMP